MFNISGVQLHKDQIPPVKPSAKTFAACVGVPGMEKEEMYNTDDEKDSWPQIRSLESRYMRSLMREQRCCDVQRFIRVELLLKDAAVAVVATMKRVRMDRARCMLRKGRWHLWLTSGSYSHDVTHSWQKSMSDMSALNQLYETQSTRLTSESSEFSDLRESKQTSKQGAHPAQPVGQATSLQGSPGASWCRFNGGNGEKYALKHGEIFQLLQPDAGCRKVNLAILYNVDAQIVSLARLLQFSTINKVYLMQ
ncbi:hypothetical protein C8R44DRAFT_725976 [Mycena epipterygia]|nr:hypothetical protein C8R44DRAFT_725976 [Mycena epipterygia]